MPSKSKLKGVNFERALVNKFKANGLNAKRAYASNGQSLGLHEEVDIVTYVDEVNLLTRKVEPVVDLKIQAKCRKKLPKVFGLTEHVDAAVFKENNGDTYIMMRLDDFMERYL